MTIEFREWPKTSRFFRDIVITEKIDGTNAAIGIKPIELNAQGQGLSNVIDYVFSNEQTYAIYAQSRNKLIMPTKGKDNAGFAGWVAEHSIELVQHLGEGLHFGEWWGSGIQRGYGLTKGEKRFSLFNASRFQFIEEESDGLLRTVPVFYEGTMDIDAIRDSLNVLKEHGSMAAPGFMNPEGICLYHSSSRQVQKVTLDNNDAGKWEYVA